MNRIILSADSTCDLSEELKARYQVHITPLHVIFGDEQYDDGVNIMPDEIYTVYEQRRVLPRTAAVNTEEYVSYFRKWTEEGDAVIHFNIGSALSSCYQNCCAAARQVGHVYPVDSRSLSSGTGLLVLEAADRIAAGMPAEQIAREVGALTSRVHASFIIDTLRFLRAGGRCSALAALGANLLNIKPCIEVDNRSGAMSVGKKYRGTLEKVLPQYVVEQLHRYPDPKTDRIFITTGGISEERIELVRKTIERTVHFDEIFATRAGCTISSHCGPNTLGILFLSK